MPELPVIGDAPSKAANGIKGGVKRMAALAKKHPAIAILLVGGVIMLAIIARRKGVGFGLGAAAGSSPDASGEDVLGGIGGLGLSEYPSSAPLGDLFFPEVPPLVASTSTPSYAWYEETPTDVQTGTVYPIEDDRDYYLQRAHELEALAGEQTDPSIRGLIADAARLTGLASLSDKEWEERERLQKEETERQRADYGGYGLLDRLRRLAAAAGKATNPTVRRRLTEAARWTGLATVTGRTQTTTTPAATATAQPSGSSTRSGISGGELVRQLQTIGPVERPSNYGTFGGQFAYLQAVVDSRKQQTTTSKR